MRLLWKSDEAEQYLSIIHGRLNSNNLLTYPGCLVDYILILVFEWKMVQNIHDYRTQTKFKTQSDLYQTRTTNCQTLKHNIDIMIWSIRIDGLYRISSIFFSRLLLRQECSTFSFLNKNIVDVIIVFHKTNQQIRCGFGNDLRNKVS